jgi:acetate kinase
MALAQRGDHLMRVLTVNPGSHSLQLHVVDVAQDADDVRFTVVDERSRETRPGSDEARDQLTEILEHQPEVVAQRLVHGGPHVVEPTVITDEVLDRVRAAADLAPQHVPSTLDLIATLRELAFDLPQVLCPDTGFHATLPRKAAEYAVPGEWRHRYGLRRYGFHGLSCSWAVRQVAQRLGHEVEELRMVIAHLGGGCSVTAVDGGRSVDTSMGFTPMEGLVMSSRSGTVDPGLLLWLLEHAGFEPADVREQLSSASGLVGLSEGRSGDTRDLVAAAAEGDEASAFALDVFCHRARREIAAVAASLPRLDALVFTGEIGSDQPEVRDAVTHGLTVLGPFEVIVVDPAEHLELAHQAARARQCR